MCEWHHGSTFCTSFLTARTCSTLQVNAQPSANGAANTHCPLERHFGHFLGTATLGGNLLVKPSPDADTVILLRPATALPYNGGLVQDLYCFRERTLLMGEGSVTRWLDLLQQGECEAVQVLWERYFHRMVALARKKLQHSPRRVADEEDVALSAFDSFCRHAENGRFPQLFDRDSLWRILVVMTARKASHLMRDQTRQKRGGGNQAAEPEAFSLDQMLSREPTPELAAQMAEEYAHLLKILADEELASVAIARMEGYTVEEIAEKLSYAPRSIKRKLQLIRNLWEKELDS